MSGVRYRPLADVDAFVDVAGGFLGAREAEHNLLWGITSQIRMVPEMFAQDPPRFGVVTDGGERVLAATLRTPPMNQVLSEVDDPRAIEVLVEGLAGDPLPGVVGPAEAARVFAERWAVRTGTRAVLDIAERIFRLDRVVPPSRPATGSWRMAEPRDRQLIAEWLTAFAEEATPGQPGPTEDPLAIADRWIAGTYRSVYLWEEGGRVVSLAGAGGQTPNGIRIGPVYTPPDARNRGYATALTAAASTDQLGRGRRFCFLFTDLANPISNHIYQQIGYEPVRDVDMYRFEPGA
jgi:predicted GNAT family acetyltransferase